MTHSERYWQNTYSGIKVTPFSPMGDQIVVADIAHALSNLCRYCGHCERFYSVAEHSVGAATVVKLLGGSVDEQRWALLHDATEAYMADLPKPVKVHPTMGPYCEAEDRLMDVIAERFGLPAGMPDIVKYADIMMLAIEAELLIPRKPQSWNLPPVPPNLSSSITIECFLPSLAKDLFLKKFQELFPETA